MEWSCTACILDLDRLVKAHLFDGTLLADDMISTAQSFVLSIHGEDKRRLTADYYLKLMEKVREIGVSHQGIMAFLEYEMVTT